MSNDPATTQVTDNPFVDFLDSWASASPALAGPFDPNVPAVLQVCKLRGSACANQVARFSVTDGSIDILNTNAAQEYVAGWKVGAGLVVQRYRLTLRAVDQRGDPTLDWIDVETRGGTIGIAGASPSTYQPIPADGKLRVRFRFGVGAAAWSSRLSILPTTGDVLHVNPADPGLLTYTRSDGLRG